jgi:hypothetical protein
MVALALLAAACGEETLVRTAPPGAMLWVDDAPIGPTPVEYHVSRAAFEKPQHYRLELPGYRPHEGELKKRVMKGRVVAACFTLGLSMIFKRPTGLADHHYVLMSPLPPPVEP